MSQDAANGAGNPINGASGGGTPAGSGESVTLAQVNEAINKAIGPRLKRAQEDMLAALQQTLPEMLKQVLPESKVREPEAAASNEASSERLTMKALQERVENLTKAVQTHQQAAKEADARARDAQMRARVQAEFARHLGADSPHLKPYMATYYDMDKRIVEGPDGTPTVKFKRDGYDESLSLELGVKELFDSELKHLVQVSKANQLPPANAFGNRGTPWQAPKATAPQGINPFDAELLDAVAKDRPELAQALAQHALSQNGTSQK